MTMQWRWQIRTSYFRSGAHNLSLPLMTRRMRMKRSANVCSEGMVGWNAACLFSFQEGKDEAFCYVHLLEQKVLTVTFRNKMKAAFQGFFKHQSVDMPYCFPISVYCCYCSLPLVQTFISSSWDDVSLQLELRSFCCIIIYAGYSTTSMKSAHVGPQKMCIASYGAFICGLW